MCCKELYNTSLIARRARYPTLNNMFSQGRAFIPVILCMLFQEYPGSVLIYRITSSVNGISKAIESGELN